MAAVKTRASANYYISPSQPSAVSTISAAAGWEMQRQALQLNEKVLGKEHMETLASKNNLADFLSEKAEWKFRFLT